MLKNEIQESIKTQTAKFIPNFFDLDFTWKDFLDLYKITNDKEELRRMSFATLAIDKTEEYTDKIDELIKSLSDIHPGSFIHALSIVHFISKYSEHIDNIDNKDGVEFRELFFKENPNKLPEKIDKQNWNGAIHSDDVDGFYIQCDGSVIWRVYYEGRTDEYTLNKGDVIFIPKFLKHSVDSLEARTAISLAFRDMI